MQKGVRGEIYIIIYVLMLYVTICWVWCPDGDGTDGQPKAGERGFCM